MLFPRISQSMIAVTFISVLLQGCGGNDERGRNGPGITSKLEGTVVVDGSSTVFRISKAAQEAFSEASPDVTVVVDNHGTGGGFSRYLAGEVDIVDASRAAKKDEEEKAQSQALDWTRYIVGYDGITLVAHPKNNWARALTIAQLKRLWEPGSSVKTWKDLDPAWPDRKIIFYSPDNDSGTYEFFVEAIIGKKGQREGVQQSSDDNTLVNGVAGDLDGLGYFGYAYFAANKDRLVALAVQNGSNAKPVLPSPETIADKTYVPLSRPLYIYVKNSSGRRPEVSQFVHFYLDRIKELSIKGGYHPPTEEDISSNSVAFSKVRGEPATENLPASGAAAP